MKDEIPNKGNEIDIISISSDENEERQVKDEDDPRKKEDSK